MLLKDNESQFKTVYDLFQKAIKNEARVETSIIVMFEIYWVLKSFYQENKQEYLEKLKKILKMEFVKIENRQILNGAVLLFQQTNLNLEDCYNLVFAEKKSQEFASFDKKALSEFRKSCSA